MRRGRFLPMLWNFDLICTDSLIMIISNTLYEEFTINSLTLSSIIQNSIYQINLNGTYCLEEYGGFTSNSKKVSSTISPRSPTNW